MSGTNCNIVDNTAAEATSSTNNHHQPSSSSSSTFLASENLCGQTLLSLVGKGHSILANIRILSERVPCAFLAAASLDKRENNGGNGKRGSSAARSSSASSSSDGLFLNILGQSSSTADQSRSKDDNQLTDDGTATSSSNRNDMEEAKKYVPFLFDFSYLHNPEEWEQSLTLPTTSTTIPAGDTNDSNEPDNLLELEREFAINHRASILEYYELFYSIYNYQKELNTFIHDLTQGYYIQYTVESVL